MLYLSGVSWRGMADYGPRLGLMRTPQGPHQLPDGLRWAADTGLYNPAIAARFDFGAYLAWLAQHRAEQLDRLLFATAPDVVGDAAATAELEHRHDALARLAALGVRGAYVLQDGVERDGVPWSRAGAVFVGGTDPWRFLPSTLALVAEARERGLWAHCGRVNSIVRWARCLGRFDSVDGTLLRFGSRNLGVLRAMLAHPEPLWRSA